MPSAARRIVRFNASKLYGHKIVAQCFFIPGGARSSKALKLNHSNLVQLL